MVNGSHKITMHYPNAHIIVPLRSLSIFKSWEKNRTVGILIVLYLCGGMEW